MLTKKQLKQIEDIIKRRFAVFSYEALGEEVLSEEQIKELKRLGLLRPSVKKFVGDGYVLGKISANMTPKGAKYLSHEEALKRAKKMKPLTDVEKRAIKWSNEHAGQYIQGISDMLVRDVRATFARTATSAIRAVQDEVKAAIRERKTTSELATALRDAFVQRHRDWQRVASTELQSAIQNGIYGEIRKNSPDGADQLVYKRPNPDACKHCNRLYLTPEGAPRIFRLKDLADSNIGRKANDWLPTVGPVHPWCQCQLHMIPDGYNFEQDKDGDWVLNFTGEQAKPTIVKSFQEIAVSSDMDDCICKYY